MCVVSYIKVYPQLFDLSRNAVHAIVRPRIEAREALDAPAELREAVHKALRLGLIPGLVAGAEQETVERVRVRLLRGR